MLSDGAGAAYLAQRDFASARSAFDEALRIKPDFAAAKVNLARLDQDDWPDLVCASLARIFGSTAFLAGFPAFLLTPRFVGARRFMALCLAACSRRWRTSCGRTTKRSSRC